MSENGSLIERQRAAITQFQEQVAALQHALDQQTARVALLAAQVGAWEAQCAAQVLAARALIDHIEPTPDPALRLRLEALALAIDADAGRLLLTRLQELEQALAEIRERDAAQRRAERAEAEAAALREGLEECKRLADSVVEETDIIDLDWIGQEAARVLKAGAGQALLAELAAAQIAIEAIRESLDHEIPDYRRPLIESALSTYDAKLKRLSLDRGPIAELAELDLSAHDDARRALRAILRARGPDELRLLLREVLEEDGETKARSE